MRHTIFWTLVLICFIISIILLVVYDVSLVKQGLDKYNRSQKEFLLFFYWNIYNYLFQHIFQIKK